jgi:hypothetical protein
MIVLLFCVFPAFAQKEQKRYALVIGNYSYKSRIELKNPQADALKLSLALYDLGFDVMRGFNQTKAQTEMMIDLFTKKLSQQDAVGVVYYAGVGFNAKGENYLVPVEASFDTVDKTAATSVPLDFLLARLKTAGNGLNLVLLDPAGQFYWPANSTSYQQSPNYYGFVKIPVPENAVFVYASGFNRGNAETCGSSSYFADAFIDQLNISKTGFAQLIKNVAEEVSFTTNDEPKVILDGRLKTEFYLVDKNHRLDPIKKRPEFIANNSLEAMFDNFRDVAKCTCGSRDKIAMLAKKIIGRYGADELKKDIIDYVKKKTAEIEKNEPVCKLNRRYNQAYVNKNWPEFYAASREIMAREGDSPLGFDVLLTLLSVGLNVSERNKINIFDTETLNIAKTALEKLKANHASAPTKIMPNGNYGVFEPFGSKENAQTWANYVIGYLMYEKMNQKKEAIPYYYKATQIGTEKKTDVSIYVKIGQYYFDEASRLDSEYRKAHSANQAKKIEDSLETKKLLTQARANADRAIDAFGRARKAAVEIKKERTLIVNLTKTLGDLYKFRFDLPPEAAPPDLETYVNDLLSKPMPDPSTEVTPIN